MIVTIINVRSHPKVISCCCVLGSGGSCRYTAAALLEKPRHPHPHPADPPAGIAIRKGPPVTVSLHAANSSPSNCRWFLVAVATLMSALMYLDRFCVAFAQSFIQEDLGLTSVQTSYIISFFFWSYALAQVPAGWLSDRWGGRITLTLYITSWSLFILLVGWSTSLWFLLAMQLGNGLSQAGAYPTSASLLSRWMPLGTRGVASSLIACGGRLGGVGAPILTAGLIVFFVPVSTSSLLTPRQVFVAEIGPVSKTLQAGSQVESTQPNAALVRSIWHGLPESTRVLVGQLAERQAALEKKNAETPVQTVGIVVSAAEVTELTEGLNAVLKQPQLVPASEIRELKLTSQATDLMARREAGTNLSQPETERLNRLVLEAVFPSGIGKVYVKGWRYVFTAYGLIGVGVALLFALVARNSPAEQPWCNAGELALINDGRVAPAVKVAPAKLDWKRVLKSRSLWLSSVSQYGTNIGWLFVATKLPEYLDKVHHVEIIQRGNWTSLPMFAGMVGMLLGGRLTDWLRVKLGVRWGRALPMGLTRFGAAAAYIGCVFTTDPWIATLLCCTVAFFTDLGVAATWAFVQDAGGRYVAVMLGFGNMWGNVGAAMAPQFYVLALNWSQNNWNVCFLLCAGAMIISGVAAIFIDASQPIVQEEA
jgi:ACS family glucarate transporter-like MFS transporter